MSACHDCPKYGNPSYQGPRQAICCMEKSREQNLQSQIEALNEDRRAAELAASRTPNNRHARRMAAKLAR